MEFIGIRVSKSPFWKLLMRLLLQFVTKISKLWRKN